MSDASLAPFVTLDRALVVDCHIFKVQKVRRRSGETGRAHDFFQLEGADWVNVVALTPDDELVLVRQERHGVEAFTVEIPGGLVDPGETAAEAAARELQEETGFAGDAPVALGWVHPNPAIQSNRCDTFLIRNVQPHGAQTLDEREEIEVLTLPLEAARQAVRDGRITHALVIAALYFHDLRRPDVKT